MLPPGVVHSWLSARRLLFDTQFQKRVLPNSRFTNDAEPMQRANLNPISSNFPPACHRPAASFAEPQTALSAPRKRTRVSRQLTPAKIGVAWEKVRRVVRDLCRQRGPECLLCRLYGSRIEFQLTADYSPITLDLEDDRILARIAGKRRTIRIVRIKSGGSGYEFRRMIRSATFLLIELVREASRKQPVADWSGE